MAAADAIDVLAVLNVGDVEAHGAMLVDLVAQHGVEEDKGGGPACSGDAVAAVALFGELHPGADLEAVRQIISGPQIKAMLRCIAHRPVELGSVVRTQDPAVQKGVAAKNAPIVG